MDTLYLNNKQYRAAQFKHCHLRKKWHELSLVRKKKASAANCVFFLTADM